MPHGNHQLYRKYVNFTSVSGFFCLCILVSLILIRRPLTKSNVHVINLKTIPAAEDFTTTKFEIFPHSCVIVTNTRDQDDNIVHILLECRITVNTKSRVGETLTSGFMIKNTLIQQLEVYQQILEYL